MPENHPQVHASVSKKQPVLKPSLPGWFYEIGVGVAAGWTVYLTTEDWKQGVGAGLLWLFGGGTSRLVSFVRTYKKAK